MESWKCQIIDHQSPGPLEWAIDDPELLTRLLDHCRQAAPYTQTFDIDEREGYNGVRLHSGNESYTAFMGKLTCNEGGRTEQRTDLGRRLEKMILMHAPEAFRSKALSILTIDFD